MKRGLYRVATNDEGFNVNKICLRRGEGEKCWRFVGDDAHDGAANSAEANRATDKQLFISTFQHALCI